MRDAMRVVRLGLVAWIVGASALAWAQAERWTSMDATRMTEARWYPGEIEDRNSRDPYRFQLHSAQVVKIETRGIGTDVTCALLDSDRRPIVESGGASHGNCEIELQLPRGEYFIELRSRTSLRFTTYELRYSTSMSSMRRVYGESRHNAPRLGRNASVDAMLIAASEHWYELETDADDISTVEIRSRERLECEILDRNGRTLVRGSRRGSSACEVETPGSRETIYLKVTGSDRRVQGEYTLTHRRARVRDDHGDTRGSATRVRARSNVDGYLTPRDVDVFQLDPRSGPRVRVYVEGERGEFTCRLLSSGGMLLQESRRGSGSRACEIDFESDGSRVYLEVRGARSSSSGSYRVRYED